MVVERWVGGIYRGISTDPKPVDDSVPDGAIFVETNTGDVLTFNGATQIWVSIKAVSSFIGPERWYVYKVGGTADGPYKALNKRTGIIEHTDTRLDLVLTPVLAKIEAGDQGIVTSFLSSGGHVFIDGTDNYYHMSAGFAGFTIPQYTTIQGPDNARLRMPNAYAGYVFRIPSWFEINPTKYTSSSPAMCIKGLQFSEDGTAARNWTGILIEGYADVTTGAGGVTAARVDGTRMTDCNIGLRLKQNNVRGWITQSYFEKLTILRPKFAGVDQALTGTDATNTNEFANNVFRDIAVQSSGDHPAYGFRNMGHRRCVYDNCIVWDVQPGQIKCTFDTFTRGGTIVAQDNVIIGGNITETLGSPSTGTFAADHPLVLAGYYSAGAPYPFYFNDGAINTTIIGGYNFGSQMAKIYIPPNTGTLTIQGRITTANTLLELVSGDDTRSTIQSWWNNSKSERFSMTRSGSSILFEMIKQTAGGSLQPIIFRMNDIGGGTGTFECFRILTNGDMQIADTRNIVLNATTGTKIGTATTQKMGFYNKAPIAQPTTVAAPTGGATVDAESRTAINAIIARLNSSATGLGLFAGT